MANFRWGPVESFLLSYSSRQLGWAAWMYRGGARARATTAFKLLIVDSIMANSRWGKIHLGYTPTAETCTLMWRSAGPACRPAHARPLAPTQAHPSPIHDPRTDFVGRGELSERQQKLGVMMSALKKLSEEFNIGARAPTSLCLLLFVACLRDR